MAFQAEDLGEELVEATPDHGTDLRPEGACLGRDEGGGRKSLVSTPTKSRAAGRR